MDSIRSIRNNIRHIRNFEPIRDDVEWDRRNSAMEIRKAGKKDQLLIKKTGHI
jgi:hypothetical protein